MGAPYISATMELPYICATMEIPYIRAFDRVRACVRASHILTRFQSLAPHSQHFSKPSRSVATPGGLAIDGNQRLTLPASVIRKAWRNSRSQFAREQCRGMIGTRAVACTAGPLRGCSAAMGVRSTPALHSRGLARANPRAVTTTAKAVDSRLLSTWRGIREARRDTSRHIVAPSIVRLSAQARLHSSGASNNSDGDSGGRKPQVSPHRNSADVDPTTPSGAHDVAGSGSQPSGEPSSSPPPPPGTRPSMKELMAEYGAVAVAVHLTCSNLCLAGWCVHPPNVHVCRRLLLAPPAASVCILNRRGPSLPASGLAVPLFFQIFPASYQHSQFALCLAGTSSCPAASISRRCCPISPNPWPRRHRAGEATSWRPSWRTRPSRLRATRSPWQRPRPSHDTLRGKASLTGSSDSPPT